MEGLHKEILRCTELVKLYEEIPNGMYGALMIKHAIKEGSEALYSGDVIEMLRCFKELKECE